MNPTTTAYRVGWLIDGSGKPAVSHRVITVDDGRIITISEARLEQPQPMTQIDLSDCTVIPGLIDSHVHLVMSGTTASAVRQDQLDRNYTDASRVVSAHLRDHLQHGVLAVRDGGDHHGHSLRYKMDPSNPARIPVAIAAPGRARHAAGRYGKLIGIPVEYGATLAHSLFNHQSQRDHLKLVNSGLNSLTQFGVETAPQFELADMAAAVTDAHQRGLPVMVHANGYLPVKLAVGAGCDSIEHGFFMGKENMRRMVDRGVVWVPTAVTMKAYSDYLIAQGHRRDPSFADVSRRNLDHQLEQIGIARQIGLTIALGTDAGSPGVNHGQSVKTELSLLVAAGFSVEEAIRCASWNGARLMGLNDRGRIAPGMRADFLAVQAPPDRLPEALDRIAYRIIQGVDFDPNCI